MNVPNRINFITHTFPPQTAILGRQVHRTLRRGLHPPEARLQPRSHHHPQVAAARNPGPSRQAPLSSTPQTCGHRAAQVILDLTAVAIRRTLQQQVRLLQTSDCSV